MPQKRRTSAELEGDDEISPSAFTAAEMWHRLPPGLQEETFGFLTLQHANRMCRVSSDWKLSLERLALFNQGTVFVQWPADSETRNPDSFLWQDTAMLKENTIRHLVVLDKSVENFHRGTLKRNREVFAIYVSKLVALPHPLTTVTFYKGEQDLHSLCGLLKLSQKAEIIRFVTFEVGWYSFIKIDESTGKKWTVPVAQDCRVLTRDAILEMEADVTIYFQARGFDVQTADSDEWLDARCSRFEHWLLTESAVDRTSLFWPFPEEQLEWLKTTLLGIIDDPAEPTFNPVIFAFDLYLSKITTYRFKEIWTFNREPLKTMGIIWPTEGTRELDVIDCAYLARLLQITPGVPPPPCEIPRDY